MYVFGRLEKKAEEINLSTDLLVQGTLDNAGNDLSIREGKRLQVLSIGCRDIRAGHTNNGGIQMVKRLRLHDLSTDLRSNSILGPTTLNGDQTVSLLDRLDNSLGIQGTDGTEVDDLGGADSLLLEELGGLEGETDGARVGDDGNVCTGLLDLGLADLDDKVLGEGGLGHGEGDSVHQLVLEDDHGVGVTDSSLFSRNGIEESVSLRVFWGVHVFATKIN